MLSVLTRGVYIDVSKLLNSLLFYDNIHPPYQGGVFNSQLIWVYNVSHFSSCLSNTGVNTLECVYKGIRQDEVVLTEMSNYISTIFSDTVTETMQLYVISFALVPLLDFRHKHCVSMLSIIWVCLNFYWIYDKDFWFNK